jgi:DNA-binding transcriptional MocR family regulator
VLDRHGATVIEDTTVAAVAFAGVAPLLAEHCQAARVISTGSLSKLCWSGSGRTVTGPRPATAAEPRAIAKTRRARLARDVDAALEQLAATIPEAIVTRPDGGSILWVRLPLEDSSRLVTAARHHGVLIAPGSIHTPSRKPGPFVRIDVDRAPALVREGLDRVAQAWTTLRRSVDSPKAAPYPAVSGCGWRDYPTVVSDGAPSSMPR